MRETMYERKIRTVLPRSFDQKQTSEARPRAAGE